MPADLTAVDPAIVKMSESKAPAQARQARPAPPPLVLATTIVTKTGEEGAFVPAVNLTEQQVFATSDGRFAAVSKAAVAKAPFLGAASEAEPTPFPYSAEVLTALVHWVQQRGVTGKTTAVFPTPVITHTDFTLLLTDDWEKTFYNQLVARHDAPETFLGLINAAEKYQVEGLLTFLVVALGCAVRGKSDEEVLATLHEFKAVTNEELAAASKTYGWLEGAKKAKVSA